MAKSWSDSIDFSLVVKVVDQQTAAGALFLEKIAVSDQGSKIRAGWIVADVYQGGIHGGPLRLDFPINLSGTQ